jgi:DNA polymerase IIIc chi subunit
MTNSSIKVIFLTSLSPQEKINKLIQTVQQHYIEKKCFYIFTENQAVTTYVDNLLWQYPKEGFIPHSCNFDPLHWIIINSSMAFPENTFSFFNLTSSALSCVPSTCKIFEFNESFGKEKKEIFEKKYKFYQECGYHLISL